MELLENVEQGKNLAELDIKPRGILVGKKTARYNTLYFESQLLPPYRFITLSHVLRKSWDIVW
jgi:hypothetical protein